MNERASRAAEPARVEAPRLSATTVWLVLLACGLLGLLCALWSLGP
jgi:hypothetical protein